MRATRAILVLFLLAVGSSPAAAVTTEQIVALKKAGVSDAVILALIERDHTVFSIAPEQIVALQREGLSEDLIIAMLKTATAGDEAARAESAAASAVVAAAISPGPEVLIVGHGPERPNTYHYDGFFTSANNPYLFPLYNGSFYQSSYGYPYEPVVPGAVPLVAPRFAPRFSSRADRPLQPRALCYAQTTTSASQGNSLKYVTECPAVLQPKRLR